MKNKLKVLTLIFLAFLLVGCKTDTKQIKFYLKETYNEDGDTYGENLDEIGPLIKNINQNFKRINSITDWTSIDTLELFEKLMVGDIKYYYKSGRLEKIILRNFGDSSQLLTEYYLFDNQLSFVYEKSYPIDDYWLKRSYFLNGALIYNHQSGDCGAPCSPDFMLKEQKRIFSKYEKIIRQIKK